MLYRGLNTAASSLQSSPQYKALCHSLQKIISWSHIINVGSRGKSCGNWTRERNAICPCLTSNHCYVENRIYLRKGLLQNTAFKSIQKLTHRKSCWKPRFRRFLATFFFELIVRNFILQQTSSLSIFLQYTPSPLNIWFFHPYPPYRRNLVLAAGYAGEIQAFLQTPSPWSWKHSSRC